MPIKVTCKCGKSFAAKEQLAGKVVKCPNCAQPIRIPQPKQKPTAGRAATAPPAGGIGDLLDEVGMVGHGHDEYTGPRCPSCDAPLAHNAMLCVECGYNLQTGKFVKGAGRVGHKAQRSPQKAEGYEGAAEEFLAKAEHALAAAPMASDRGEKESWFLPYVTAAALIAVAGVVFLVWMGFSRWINMPEDVAADEASQLGRKVTVFVALGLWGLGGLLSFVATIKIAVYAFRHDDTVHGILSLLIPVYAVVYACLQRGRLDREVKLWSFGLFLSLSALGIFFFEALLSGLSFSTASLGQVMFGILIVLLFVGGMLLMFAGWIFSSVAAFMERVRHGILAIIYPIYGATFCVWRKDEHPVPARLWVTGWACLVSSGVLSFLGKLMITATQGDVSASDIAKAVGEFLATVISPPIVHMLILVGLVYAAIGLHNVLFATEKRDRVTVPRFGTATYLSAVMTGIAYLCSFTLVMFLVIGLWVAFSIQGIGGHVYRYFVFVILLYCTPLLFVAADMVSTRFDAEYRRGMIVAGLFTGLFLIVEILIIVIAYFAGGIQAVLTRIGLS